MKTRCPILKAAIKIPTLKGIIRLIISLYIMFFSLIYAGDENCRDLEKNYLLGDYKKCALQTEYDGPIRCKYISALCALANGDYDRAKYGLSFIGPDVRSKNFGDINALALTSLVEVSFMQKDLGKAVNLSYEVNKMLSKDLPGSFPYLVSELLMIKTHFQSSEVKAAVKELGILKTAHIDEVFYEPFNP